jgi:ABC-2 type transport system ATP-binding protein
VIRSGTVEVLGLPAGAPELRRRIGYMTQAPSVYGDLTTRENLDYFARIVEASPGRVEEVLETVDLVRVSRRQVRSLSGGERSRVSLAAALLGRPDVLVLDEPTVGLDPVLRRDLWNLFGRLAADGVTLLISSHVMDEATRCDRLLLMREGQLLADDTLDGVLTATGKHDVEQAFLTFIDRAATAGHGSEEVSA